MASPHRGIRLALAGVAVLVLAAVSAPPAWSQTSGPGNGGDPASAVNVEDFEDRARRWSEARRRAREEALRRAEELANQARTTSTTTTTTTTVRTTTTTTTAAPTTTTASSTSTTSPASTTVAPPTTTGDGEIKHPIPAGTTEEQWHALRQCESTQNYRAISRSGRYRGAYQFSISTWNWVAGMHYPELVGVDPINAKPSDQDKMAYKLYEINGWNPWPTCRKRLPT